MAEDKSVLDFPLMEDTQDDDVLYVLRGTGPDRDRHQKKSDLLKDVGKTLVTVAEDVSAGDPIGLDMAGVYRKAGIRVSQPVYPSDNVAHSRTNSVVIEEIGNDHYIMQWTVEATAAAGGNESYIRVFDVVAGEIRFLTDSIMWVSGTQYEYFTAEVKWFGSDRFAMWWYIGGTGGMNLFCAVAHYNDDFADPTPGTVTFDVGPIASEIVGSYESYYFRMTTVGNWIWIVNNESAGGNHYPQINCGLWNGAGTITWEGWENLETTDYQRIDWQFDVIPMQYTAAGVDSSVLVQLKLDKDGDASNGLGAKYLGLSKYFVTIDAGTGMTITKMGKEKHTDEFLGIASMWNFNTFLEARIAGDSVVVRAGEMDPVGGAVNWISNAITFPHVNNLDTDRNTYFQARPSTCIRYLGSGYFVVNAVKSQWERTLYIGRYINGTIYWIYEDFQPLNAEHWKYDVVGYGGTICILGDMYTRDRYFATMETAMIGQAMEFVPYSGLAGADAVAASEVHLVYNSVVRNAVIAPATIPNKDYYMQQVGTLNGSAESFKIKFTNQTATSGYFAFWLPNGTMYYIWENLASSDPRLGGTTLSIELDIGAITTAAGRVSYLLPILNAIEGITATSPAADELVITNDSIGAVQAVYFAQMPYEIEILTKGYDKLGLTARPTRMKVGRTVTSSLLSVQPELLASNNKLDMKRIGKATLWEQQDENLPMGFKPRGKSVELVQTIMPIGSWDMSIDDGVLIYFPPHMKVTTTVVSIQCVIHADKLGTICPLNSVVHPGTGGGLEVQGGFYQGVSGGSSIVLYRRDAGTFDSINYSDTTINRGFILITSFAEDHGVPTTIPDEFIGPGSA